MITSEQLIEICQENDNLEFIFKDEKPRILASFYDISDVEISTLFYCWINPIKNDDISDARNKIFQIWLRSDEDFVENRYPLSFIESRVWEKYKDNISTLYKHYDMNSFYYLCCKIHFYYVKENLKSIEDAFLITHRTLNTDKYYHNTLCRMFGGNTQIQNEKNSGACANLNMILKYLVWDLKLWKKLDKKKLLIPLTYKITLAAKELLIINNTTNTLANSIKITEFAKDLLGEDDFMKIYAGLLYYYQTNIQK